MKSSTLKRLYKRYNRTYFENLLPVDVDIAFADIGDDVDGLASPWAYKIEIHCNLIKRDKIHGVLLHEMIHMEQYHVEEKELDDEKEHHDIEFYFRALELFEYTGYPIA